MSDLFNTLLIIRTSGIGPAKFYSLVQKFGSVDAAADALGADTALRDSVMREMERAEQLGIKYITETDEYYPAALRKIKNHPPVLSVRGNLATLQRAAIGMVGTRHATAAGMEFMADLACKFAEHNYAVISGMAIGTDTAAHRGALRAAGNENTIAVLAGGVDYIWPVENESLYWDIVARGAVISEMPVGFQPIATNFVQRNRLIAGIGEKLILGEADANSGSMHTARFASEYERDVYAVPSHPSDPRSSGPNSLIRTGRATLCMGAGDFFHAQGNDSKKTKKSSDDDSRILLLDKLSVNPVSESVLADIVKKTVSEIKRDLVILELQGLVRKIDGGYVRV